MIFSSAFKIKEFIITDLSIAVTAQLGPGTIGIVTISEEVK